MKIRINLTPFLKIKRRRIATTSTIGSDTALQNIYNINKHKLNQDFRLTSK
ncbi:MAG: hypothetical protein PSV16_07040 [Flavobacterium sp.]|nr:hypothetical protein [Flavobacterium sp.]